MALINKNTGEYLQINRQLLFDSFIRIRCRLYHNKSEAAQTPEKFVNDTMQYCDNLNLDALADASKSIIDNLITAMYNAVKTIPQNVDIYTDAIDGIWTNAKLMRVWFSNEVSNKIVNHSVYWQMIPYMNQNQMVREVFDSGTYLYFDVIEPTLETLFNQMLAEYNLTIENKAV